MSVQKSCGVAAPKTPKEVILKNHGDSNKRGGAYRGFPVEQAYHVCESLKKCNNPGPYYLHKGVGPGTLFFSMLNFRQKYFY